MTPTPTLIVAYLALFAAVGFLTIFAALTLGWFLRPSSPSAVKGEAYECGEPAIGTSFVQFDLRFYVIALLFIIFDVEVAFFFPWATVFGKATQLMDPNLDKAVVASASGTTPEAVALTPAVQEKYAELGLPAAQPAQASSVAEASQQVEGDARKLALCSIADIAIFFFVLLVGFAYVWRRGDLTWVRAIGPPGSEKDAVDPG